MMQSCRAAILPITLGIALAAATAGTTAAAAAPRADTAAQAVPEANDGSDNGGNGAPRDWGYGPNIAPPADYGQSLATPTATPQAAQDGAFSTPFPWPLVAIHTALLPDGRVMSYGSTANPNNPIELVYDIWTPGSSTASSHLTLPNTTGADVFCAAQTLLPSGSLIIADGNPAIRSRKYGATSVKQFDYRQNSLNAQSPSQLARWYPALLSLPDGRLLLLGGRIKAGQPAATPEISAPGGGWTLLSNATSQTAYGSQAYAWYYPLATLAPDGMVKIFARNGSFSLNPNDAGTLTPLPLTLPSVTTLLPLAQFAPGKMLVLNNDAGAEIVDLNTATPSVTPTGPLDQLRHYANATILADGQVLITGGGTGNSLRGAAYTVERFSPATNSFTPGATANKPRLYHGTALLLPDATVLVAGGGHPGPISNLNAEIYYPPYLFAADGSPAPRPHIANAPATTSVGATLTLTMANHKPISRLTLARFGSNTHARNYDQRFFNLSFQQTGTSVTTTLPNNPNTLLPGYYMLFALNQAGTPSPAAILTLTASPGG